MQIWELLLVGVSLSMDALAISICKGLTAGRVAWRQVLVTGLWFGGFQALMPALGYLLGSRFQAAISSIDHWIAFILLGLIGGNMIREVLRGEEERVDSSFSPQAMLPLALATSIDALAVGVTFAFLGVNIVLAAGLIGAATFVISAVGVRLGRVVGERCQSWAQLAGGVVLILIGVKILAEHMGWLG